MTQAMGTGAARVPFTKTSATLCWQWDIMAPVKLLRKCGTFIVQDTREIAIQRREGCCQDRGSIVGKIPGAQNNSHPEFSSFCMGGVKGPPKGLDRGQI